MYRLGTTTLAQVGIVVARELRRIKGGRRRENKEEEEEGRRFADEACGVIKEVPRRVASRHKFLFVYLLASVFLRAQIKRELLWWPTSFTRPDDSLTRLTTSRVFRVGNRVALFDPKSFRHTRVSLFDNDIDQPNAAEKEIERFGKDWQVWEGN